ncbi:MAG: SLATT domain-containing protein [Betaproteobacteria bacterium]
MKPFLDDLRTNAWRTAGARYNASRRLKRREWVSTSSLALLSALSIAVAYSQKVYAKDDATLDDYLSIVAMGVGVLLLVISLLEWGAGYGVRAADLFKNAELLTNYQLKVAQTLKAIESGDAVTLQEVDSLRLEYEAVKDRCTTNHQPIDDALFRAQKRLDSIFRDGQKPNGTPQMCWLVAQSVKVVWFVSELWFFGFIWAGVLCSIAYAFCLASSGGGTPLTAG